MGALLQLQPRDGSLQGVLAAGNGSQFALMRALLQLQPGDGSLQGVLAAGPGSQFAPQMNQ